VTSLRALLEGRRAESLDASDELLAGTFRDPEGWYYLARQLGYLSESERALMALSRSVDWGFFCFPAMAADPWLDSLRGYPEFRRIIEKSHALHKEALGAFQIEKGAALLGVFP
jgi:hypothetical protein